MWPNALLATKKASFGIKTRHLAIPLIMGQENADFFKKLIFISFFSTFSRSKVVFWVKNGVFGGVLD